MTTDCDEKTRNPEQGQGAAKKDLSGLLCSSAVSPQNQRGRRKSSASDASQEGAPDSPKGVESSASCEGRPYDEKSPLNPDDLAVLKEIVREYKSHRIDFSVLPRRPEFTKPRVNSGITCNAEIRRRALKKARADPDCTGGSLSSLIEMLLWKYLGSPPDVVERFPK